MGKGKPFRYTSAEAAQRYRDGRARTLWIEPSQLAALCDEQGIPRYRIIAAMESGRLRCTGIRLVNDGGWRDVLIRLDTAMDFMVEETLIRDLSTGRPTIH